MNGHERFPVAVIGGGPVGLAAAARLVERGMPMAIFERGPSPGHAIRAWGHVRLFTPWGMNVDEAARSQLEEIGWVGPDPEVLPRGDELVRDYLEPLARHPRIAPHLHVDARVVGVTRLQDEDPRATGGGRFLIRWTDGAGKRHALTARAVIDATGTWFSPNQLGMNGRPVAGEPEAAAAGRIAYGIPDVLGHERAHYKGASTLVVGGGHSAMNVVLDLRRLRREASSTQVHWALNRSALLRDPDSPLNASLSARRALDAAAIETARSGEVELLAPFAFARVGLADGGVEVVGRLDGALRELRLDRIVVATGFHPDQSLLSDLNLEFDPQLQAPRRLAPLIDPKLHSCQTVPLHGASELAHPEPGIFLIGSKSYGRAPNFLLRTGYEQVRSVVAALAGDHAAADATTTLDARSATTCCPPPSAQVSACPSARPQACC